MSSIYDFSKTINDLRKEKKYKDALSFFKSNKLKFNENEIAGNEYLVSNILYCLRDINETDYGFLFLNEYNIEINKETKSRIPTEFKAGPLQDAAPPPIETDSTENETTTTAEKESRKTRIEKNKNKKLKTLVPPVEDTLESDTYDTDDTNV